MQMISIKSTVYLVLDNRKLVLTSIQEFGEIFPNKWDHKGRNSERYWLKLLAYFSKLQLSFNNEKKGEWSIETFWH